MASKETVYRIHPITVNNTSKNQAAGVEFVTWLYKSENYRMLLTECLDLLPSYDVGGLDSYYASIKWADGFKDLKGVTPQWSATSSSTMTSSARSWSPTSRTSSLAAPPSKMRCRGGPEGSRSARGPSRKLGRRCTSLAGGGIRLPPPAGVPFAERQNLPSSFD